MNSNNFIFSQSAYQQYQLMKSCDFTLENKELRLQISGKDCDGFNYELGFDLKKENDLEVPIKVQDEINLVDTSSIVYLQPFSEFFCKNIEIDFVLVPEQNLEGFVIKNNDQSNFKGKFFKNQEYDIN